MEDAKDVIARYFQRFYTEEEYIEKTYKALAGYGFDAHNTIAAVCICRDEISQPLIAIARRFWGETFNLAGLGGMFIAGKTALRAAIHHAPETGDRLRYVFYALPHIAIGGSGELGICSRRGIERSTACGALVGFHSEMTKGEIRLLSDEDDVEMGVLKRRMLGALPYGKLPELLEFTKAARLVIQRDLERAITDVVDTERADYALFTGIQIHGPDGGNYTAPDASYGVVKRQRYELII